MEIYFEEHIKYEKEENTQYENEEQFRKEIEPQLRMFDYVSSEGYLSSGIYCLELYKIYKVYRETEQVNQETKKVKKVIQEVYMPRPYKVYTFAKVSIEGFNFYNFIGCQSEGKYCWAYPKYNVVIENKDNYWNGYKYIWFLFFNKRRSYKPDGYIDCEKYLNRVSLKEIIIYYNIN